VPVDEFALSDAVWLCRAQPLRLTDSSLATKSSWLGGAEPDFVAFNL